MKKQYNFVKSYEKHPVNFSLENKHLRALYDFNFSFEFRWTLRRIMIENYNLISSFLAEEIIWINK